MFKGKGFEGGCDDSSIL